jgi:uncharacterized protein with PQ loop repeat
MMFGIAEGIRFDALHPNGESYFGEITFTEITQEIILFLLFLVFLFLGWKWKDIRPVALPAALFFLIAFFREFNFLTEYWSIPSVILLIFIGYIVFRERKKISLAVKVFFSQPASSWLFSGFLVTFVFSRLFGRAKFWRILYDENNYRLAKAVAEEGIELLGNTLMLIAAIEFLIAFAAGRKESEG